MYLVRAGLPRVRRGRESRPTPPPHNPRALVRVVHRNLF
jgi:hypothetical protein